MVIWGSAAVQDRTRNTKQVCKDCSVDAEMKSVSHCNRDGGQGDHQKNKNLNEKHALERRRCFTGFSWGGVSFLQVACRVLYFGLVLDTQLMI